MRISKDGAFYSRNLPHYRAPGAIYHCRFSLHEIFGRFRQEWMFEEVESAILSQHKLVCLVFAYVIMADHTHAVLQPIPIRNDPAAWCDFRSFPELERIVGRIKGRSSRLINKRLGRMGTLWQAEPFDRMIRNDRDLEEVIDYIHCNPVRWNLVSSPERYRWSSLRTIYSGKEQYRGWFDLSLTPIGQAGE